MLLQEHGLGHDLNGVGFLGHARPFGITPSRAFLVVYDFGPIRATLDDIDDAQHAEGFALQFQAAKFCSLRQAQFLRINEP